MPGQQAVRRAAVRRSHSVRSARRHLPGPAVPIGIEEAPGTQGAALGVCASSRPRASAPRFHVKPPPGAGPSGSHAHLLALQDRIGQGRCGYHVDTAPSPPDVSRGTSRPIPRAQCSAVPASRVAARLTDYGPIASSRGMPCRGLRPGRAAPVKQPGKRLPFAAGLGTTAGCPGRRCPHVLTKHPDSGSAGGPVTPWREGAGILPAAEPLGRRREARPGVQPLCTCAPDGGTDDGIRRGEADGSIPDRGLPGSGGEVSSPGAAAGADRSSASAADVPRGTCQGTPAPSSQPGLPRAVPVKGLTAQARRRSLQAQERGSP